MPDYPSKALQAYLLRSELGSIVAGGSGTGPPGPAGTSGHNGAAGARTPVQSATAPATVSTGTISTAGVTVARVSPTVDITGVILAVGTIAGQECAVINESGFSITFAAAATSHVATGVLCVIPALYHRPFVWDTVTGRWYADGPIGGTGSGTFGAGTFGSLTFGGH